VRMHRFWRQKRLLSSARFDPERPPSSRRSGGRDAEPLDTSLEANRKRFEHVFHDCSDVVFRDVEPIPGARGLLLYTEGIVETKDINDHLLHPLMHLFRTKDGAELDLASLELSWLSVPQMKKVRTVEDAAFEVLNASVVFLLDGSAHALSMNLRGGTRRGVEESTTETVVRGPKEGFTESLRVNTALVRFKIKTPDLKTVSMTKGVRTQTAVVVSYIEGLADPAVVEEAIRRIDAIDIDGVLESGYIEELIEDNPYSPFPQLQYTERPDTVAAQLLEGRVAIFVDGTPFVLVAPTTLWQMLQASEDYYERYFIANLIRWLRYIFVFVALYLPALYIAVTTFHQDMLPSTLILSIAAAREAIPFPAIIEVLIMELSFETLREAGIRLPKTIGQAVSILGALVVGQAAVEAGIVSAPIVIVVSATGIASFAIPRFNLAITIRLLRFPMIVLAAGFGLFGLIIGSVWLLAHLTRLRSFGVPYLSGITPYRRDEMKDILVRAPWWRMALRPLSIGGRDRRRLGRNMQRKTEPKESW